ncbi:uncharacterized protein IL334_003252 [Kwoniella shivajii]|uniref:Uncharacterized protein n=1 Tax=Kwoniella shivajii TaxID=564305 RepID=A0ABZ1CXK3_9TREE|nr:hypothetical protein IL334_003252 [Kwoniella shivajii]
MQIQNASTAGYGYEVQLSSNITWTYPFLPGEPPNVIRYNFAACVPSNVTLADLCCSAVNGQFVNQSLSNSRTVNESELRSILDTKYPGQNVSTFSSVITGNLTNATDAGSTGEINWCSLPYSPMSTKPLHGVGLASGNNLGNIPESINSWIKCFNDNVPPNAINDTQAAYVCAADDVQTGGTIEGFNRYVAKKTGDARNMAQVSVWSLVGFIFVMAIWSN